MSTPGDIRERLMVAIGVAECDLDPVVADAICANVRTVVGEWLRGRATAIAGDTYDRTAVELEAIADEIDPPAPAAPPPEAR